MRRVPDPLVRTGTRHPDELALIDGDEALTWGTYARRVAGLRQALLAADVRPGDRVALRPDRSVHDAALLAAILRIPATAVPLNRRLAAAELTAALNRIRPAVLCGSALSKAGYRPRMRLSASDLEAVETSTADPGTLPSYLDLDRPATVLHTSGSTGRPKAVVHRYENHYLSALGSLAAVPLASEDRWLCPLPLYHVGGLAVLIRCEQRAACTILAGRHEDLARVIDERAPTHLSLVSTQLRRLLDHTSSPPASLRAVLVGGGPFPHDLHTRALEAGWPVLPTYGSTEMSSQVATRRRPEDRDPRIVGPPLPYRRVRIAEDGEIWVGGRTLFEGYLTGDGSIRRPDRDGWFPTSDRGTWTEDGTLTVHGRIDRRFVSGGENVDPIEIESALTELEAVDRAVVVSVPDEEYGERPVAFVRWAGNARSLPEVRTELEDRLARFKHPDRLLAWPEDLTAKEPIDREALTRRAREVTR